MKKVNEILKNSKYKEYLTKLEVLEKDRKFCKHGMNHFMDVARIAYIINLEEGLGHAKEIIYAIALLHDIGRVLEYEKGVSHHEGSVIISNFILNETTFTRDERDKILKAIDEHRSGSEDSLSKLIYKADKLSRRCFECKAKKECYWPKEKRNLTINY